MQQDIIGNLLWKCELNLQIDLYSILLSLFSGFVSTGAMTLIEIPFWKKWGLSGILEWHENQLLTCKFFRASPRSLHFWGIFLLHFVNGSLGGLGLLFALILVPSLKEIPFMALGVFYGFFLWILTLLPIHKPITGINPLNHSLGKGPVIVSLIGHGIYGIILATLFIVTIHIEWKIVNKRYNSNKTLIISMSVLISPNLPRYLKSVVDSRRLRGL